MRRLKQDGETPPEATIASVAKEIAKRDKRDSSRATAPLKQAKDAIYIDTSDMSISEVVDYVVSVIA